MQKERVYPMKTRKSPGGRGLFASFLRVVLVLIFVADAWAEDPTRFESEIEGFENADLASPAAQDTWARKADVPTATSLHSASVVDGKIYVIGGTDDLYGWADYWSTVWVYDPATDTWTRQADMPAGRARLSASVLDGKTYAIGGSPHRDAEVPTVEMYDPAANGWTRKADMPRARNWLSASAVNGKIYVIGGKIYPSETMVSTVEVYDPSTDSWTRKADMPTARGMHSASVVDGKIYVIGGVTGAYGPWVSTVEAYDPATDTWMKKADMPTAKAGHSSSALYGKVYVIGGANSWNSSLSTVDVYDPATDTWAKGVDMPTARLCHASSAVNGKIYVIGGSLHPSSWTPTSTVEVYDPGLAAPPPDFNGDEVVDIEDLIMLIESWGQDEPSLDVAPPPFGDGIIDVQDLEVLMSYWQQEILPVSLAAYWKLDETEGDIAYDSVGGYDGTLSGTPMWQPTGGKVQGALQFDGIDDSVGMPFVLNPADGEFSVFAWIQAGAPGQVVLSQIGGVDWLSADPGEGKLMANLSRPAGGRVTPPPLASETVITDGDWHRIGFVRDGSHRILYVDDAEVARDTQTSLEGSAGGLSIGAGKALDDGTFWSGLIDDVRIYNQAVEP